MSDAPIPMRWMGDSFVPLNAHWQREADKALVVGEVYRVTTVEERSAASHRHMFAALNSAWMNLPEDQAERFATAEHLRRFALIKAGYCDERSIVCASKAEAQRVAAFIRPMDDFAIVTISEAVVRVFTAKSQSVRAMGKADFQASKQAVLDVVADMLGVTADELARTEAA